MDNLLNDFCGEKNIISNEVLLIIIILYIVHYLPPCLEEIVNIYSSYILYDVIFDIYTALYTTMNCTMCKYMKTDRSLSDIKALKSYVAAAAADELSCHRRLHMLMCACSVSLYIYA